MDLASISTTGIMFDQPSRSDLPFPRLDDVGYSWAGERTWPHDVGALSSWLVVASNPYRVRYFDDDSQAMDETNIDAVLASFVEYDAPDDIDTYDPTEDDADADAEGRRPIYAYGRVYLIRPDDAAAIDLAVSYRDALESYALLDESTYSEREGAAWDEYVVNGLRSDTMRELSDLDDDTEEALDDAWNDAASAASDYLHSYDGWTGSHSPDFSECIAKAFAASLIRAFWPSFSPWRGRAN